jgi:hypothetical protein
VLLPQNVWIGLAGLAHKLVRFESLVVEFSPLNYNHIYMRKFKTGNYKIGSMKY